MTRRSLLATLVLALILPAICQAQTTANLTILHTNDTHSRIDPFPDGTGKQAGRGSMMTLIHTPHPDFIPNSAMMRL